MIRRTLVFVAFVALACAAAPDAARVPAVEPGVTVGGLQVAGLTSELARARLESAVAKPIVVVRANMSWWAWRDTLRVRAPLERALIGALAARQDGHVPLNARWSHAAVDRFVAQLADGFDKAPVDADLIGIAKNKPLIRGATLGIAVKRRALRHELELELSRGTREPIALPTRAIRADKTRRHFGHVIWIDRGTNTLRLFDGTKLVRVFRVATGQSVYPTPSGIWEVVDKQRYPWWRPPDSPWARGLKPVPPGPGNPLGTRWLGLNAAGVGIHGTPDAASIGYSASHGCIRMHISDAEWLFDHVALGTPVAIT